MVVASIAPDFLSNHSSNDGISNLGPRPQPFPFASNSPKRSSNSSNSTAKQRKPSSSSSSGARSFVLPQPQDPSSSHSFAFGYPADSHIPTARPLSPIRNLAGETSVRGGPGDGSGPHLHRPGTSDSGGGGQDQSTTTGTDRHSQRYDLINSLILVLLCFIFFSCIFIAIQVPMKRKTSFKKKTSDFESSRETSIASTASFDLNSSKVDFFPPVRSKNSLSFSYSNDSNSSITITTDHWEVPRQNLHFSTSPQLLGEGNFGQVWKCEAFNLFGDETSHTVAVKMLKKNHTEKEMKDLLMELNIMKKLEPHPNVVTLYGCCSSEPVYLVLEYVQLGKLQTFLRNSRQQSSESSISSSLTSNELTSFAYQVACGMEYISSKGVSN